MIRVSLSGLGAVNANPLSAGGAICGAGVGTTAGVGATLPGASGSFGTGAGVVGCTIPGAGAGVVGAGVGAGVVGAGVGAGVVGAGVGGAGVVGAGSVGCAAPGLGWPPTGTHLPSISTFRPPSSAGCAGWPAS